MIVTSIFSVSCPCGLTVEWPDTSREHVCGCGRLLTVVAWPNADLLTVPARTQIVPVVRNRGAK